MKKLLLTGVCVMFTFFGYAQTTFGLKAGPNFSDLVVKEGSDSENFGTKVGFHVGGMAKIMVSEKFAFQPEVLFSSVGANSEETESFGVASMTVKSKMNLNYVSIPLMGKFFITEGLNLQVGPQIGFLVSAKGKIETEIEGISLDDFGVDLGEMNGEVDLKDETKSLDFGLNFGLGYELPIGLIIDARYNLGLVNIDEAEDDDITIRNKGFQVSVGYLFNK